MSQCASEQGAPQVVELSLGLKLSRESINQSMIHNQNIDDEGFFPVYHCPLSTRKVAVVDRRSKSWFETFARINQSIDDSQPKY